MRKSSAELCRANIEIRRMDILVSAAIGDELVEPQQEQEPPLPADRPSPGSFVMVL